MRALTATGAVALSIWALNLSGNAGDWEAFTAAGSNNAARAAAPGSGAGTAVSGNAGRDLQASGIVGAGLLEGAVFADPGALVPFPHSVIGGYDGERSLVVNPAGFGRPPAGFLMAPLEQLHPSSPFGFRVSPISGAAGDFHLGQDYAAACETKVYAADSGVVRAAGWHPWGGGNRVEIDHGNGLITTYNHLDAIAVRTGDSVRAGQVIARVGTTGWSTGCHLHFETILDGRHTSPLKWGLLPTPAIGGSEAVEMRSYLPGSGSASGGNISWALPLGHDEDPGDGVQARTSTTPAFPFLARPPAAGAVSPSSPFAPAPSPSSSGTPLAPTPLPSQPALTPPPASTTPSPTPTPTATTPPPSAPSTSGSSTTPSPNGTTPAPTPTTTTPTPTVTTPPATATTPPPPTTPSPTTPTPTPTTTAPAPTPTETTPPPTEATPSPTPSPSPAEPAPTVQPTLTSAPDAANPAPATPAPTTPAPDRCVLLPGQETTSPDPSAGTAVTNPANEQLPEDATCDPLVSRPADPQ